MYGWQAGGTHHTRMMFIIFTVRNDVAKVMFLQACACPQGGVPDQAHPLGPGTPPGTRCTPRTRYTPQTGYTPRTRYTPGPAGTPPTQAHTPTRDTATAADGTHPTGMQSCLQVKMRCRKAQITVSRKEPSLVYSNAHGALRI